MWNRRWWACLRDFLELISSYPLPQEGGRHIHICNFECFSSSSSYIASDSFRHACWSTNMARVAEIERKPAGAASSVGQLCSGAKLHCPCENRFLSSSAGKQPVPRLSFHSFLPLAFTLIILNFQWEFSILYSWQNIFISSTIAYKSSRKQFSLNISEPKLFLKCTADNQINTQCFA